MAHNQKIILASNSKGRERVLKEAGFNFDVMPSNIDESKIRDLHFGVQSLKIRKNFHDENPENLVKLLARAKAEDVAAKIQEDKIVVGADTICVFGGKVIEKPRDKSEAARMLSAFSGKTHMIMTGLTVVARKEKKSLADVSIATVTFRKLSKAEIDDYLKTDDALRFAGGYTIDGTKSMKFVDCICGSYSGIIGMPLEKLIPMLEKCKDWDSVWQK